MDGPQNCGGVGVGLNFVYDLDPILTALFSPFAVLPFC